MLKILVKLLIPFCCVLMISNCSKNPIAIQNSDSAMLAFGSSYGVTYVFMDAGVSFRKVKYITSENMGASPLNANRDWIGVWEQYSLVKNSDGTISLRSFATYGGNFDFRFVIASNNGTGPLIANATNNSSNYSRFYLENAGNGIYGMWYYIKCKGNGKYLETQANPANNTYQIYADAGGKYANYQVRPTYPNAIPAASAQTTDNQKSWRWPGLIFGESAMVFRPFAHTIPSGTTATVTIDGKAVSISNFNSGASFAFSPAVAYSHDITVAFNNTVAFDSLRYDYLVGIK